MSPAEPDKVLSDRVSAACIGANAEAEFSRRYSYVETRRDHSKGVPGLKGRVAYSETVQIGKQADGEMFRSERKRLHGVMPNAGANTRGPSGVVGYTSSHRRRSEEMTRSVEVSELLC